MKCSNTFEGGLAHVVKVDKHGNQTPNLKHECNSEQGHEGVCICSCGVVLPKRGK